MIKRGPILCITVLCWTIQSMPKSQLNWKKEEYRKTLLMAYHTYTEKKQSTINNYYPMMYGGWGWRYYPSFWSVSPYPYGYWNGYSGTYAFTEGTLIIDAINAKTNRLIWRGSISDAITNPSDLHKKAIQAVHIIFSKFPIKPGSKDIQTGRPVAHKNYPSQHPAKSLH